MHPRPFWIALLGAILMMTSTPASASASRTAMFAGGCFWCMQPSFDNTLGVTKTRVGYAGGDASTAHYDAVSTGKTGHVEVIEVQYDPKKVSYEKLLETYWENIDPTDGEGQFADRGSQYIPAIYYADETQQRSAEASKKEIAAKFAPKPILVKLLPTVAFYPAEEYHQRYYEKNKAHYDAYKTGSGRAGFIEKNWKKH